MNENTKLHKDVLDAVREGYTAAEICGLLGFSRNYIGTILAQLIIEKRIRRVSRGKYEVLSTLQSEAPETNGKLPRHSWALERPEPGNALIERDKRKVELPTYMRQRASVILFVERSPQEIENVVRLELCIGDHWIPFPVNADLRVCVGDDVPRWSATQETYLSVKAYRVTLRTGEQMDYPHNPDLPLTIDTRRGET